MKFPDHSTSLYETNLDSQKFGSNTLLRKHCLLMSLLTLQDQVIDEKGPVGYFSTLPLKEMREVESEFPVKMSFSAGAYVCNFLMYKTLAYTQGTGVKAGFVHLPHLGGDGDQVFQTISKFVQLLSK